MTPPPTSASLIGDSAISAEEAFGRLTRRRPTVLQINVGRLCNQACHHCHVEAGPGRKEIMEAPTVDRLVNLLQGAPAVRLVDITGGAPELNPHFEDLVKRVRALGREVMVRSNLTVLMLPGREHLVSFFAAEGVHVVASLPCYTEDNVDEQRGTGVFRSSIEALRRLNAAGYGVEGSDLQLDLVYNPLGAFLPPPQEALEKDYKRELRERFGILFSRLLTITNMPIKRFAEQLRRDGGEEAYMRLLTEAFHPENLERVMCRELVSVGYDGRLYDCDFNQMLEMPLGGGRTIFEIDSLDALRGAAIAKGPHCFGCTAGSGSSCTGALS